MCLFMWAWIASFYSVLAGGVVCGVGCDRKIMIWPDTMKGTGTAVIYTSTTAASVVTREGNKEKRDHSLIDSCESTTYRDRSLIDSCERTIYSSSTEYMV